MKGVVIKCSLYEVFFYVCSFIYAYIDIYMSYNNCVTLKNLNKIFIFHVLMCFMHISKGLFVYILTLDKPLFQMYTIGFLQD